jgi:hypothetical protein
VTLFPSHELVPFLQTIDDTILFVDAEHIGATSAVESDDDVHRGRLDDEDTVPTWLEHPLDASLPNLWENVMGMVTGSAALRARGDGDDRLCEIDLHVHGVCSTFASEHHRIVPMNEALHDAHAPQAFVEFSSHMKDGERMADHTLGFR